MINKSLINGYGVAILVLAVCTAFVLVSAIPSIVQAAVCCTITIQSDETNTVVGDGNAVAVTQNPAWTAAIPGATWIWKSGVTNPNEMVAFEKTFTVVGTVLSATLDIASDNSYKVFIDGVEVAADLSATNFTLATQDTYNLTASTTPGTHTLRIEVTNNGVFSELNPAGLLYKFFVECLPPPCCCCCGSSNTSTSTSTGGISISVSNSGCIVNTTSANASTGGNSAWGSKGGRGGRGGDVQAGGSGNNGGAQAGSGGSGGSGGPGGFIQSGPASATATTTNVLNHVRIRIN